MTAPTFAAPGGPPKDDDWSSLEDGSFDVPAHEWSRSQAGTKPAPDKYAHTDVASGVSLGSGASTTKNVNRVAQFKCPACNGSGRFIRGFHNPVDYGPCNKCKGVGKLKTDPETRTKQKKAREDAFKRRKGEFVSAHIPEATWVAANLRHFEFARSMEQALGQYGAWTDGQLAAIRRCMARDEERKVAKQAQAAAAPTVTGAGFERMLAAFASAKASGLKYPKLRIGEFTFALASERSQYNGKALFVRHITDGYLGRIDLATARFIRAGACGREMEQAITAICSDPLAAAVLHGKQTGHCACCGLELTNEESVRLGIGPICRDKWGM